MAEAKAPKAEAKEIKFDIVEKIGVISESPTGWTKEINRVSWNGRDPKYDVRDWNTDHTKMRKGITLTDDEAILLRDVLNEADL